MKFAIKTAILCVAVTILVLLYGSCAVAQDVHYNFMPGTDFSKYHTYKWVAIEGGAHPNQIMDAEIKQAVDSQLASKGLTKTDSDKADLYVGYQVAIDQEKQWNGYAWAVACAGVAWPLRLAPPSTTARWSSTCMTRPRNNLCGRVKRQKH